jgi:hypothetical protein
MGLQRFGVGVERCDILGAEYLGGTLGGHWGNPRYRAAALTGAHWKNLSYVPPGAPERVAN